jgi:DNA-binding transcriptional ArsR family regulator
MPATAEVFEALAAPRRRDILKLVWDRELSAGEIHRAVREVSFGAVSQHLAVLEASGLVSRREEGRFRYYAAKREDMGPLGEWLESMWDDALARLKRHAESESARSGRRSARRRRTPRKESSR